MITVGLDFGTHQTKVCIGKIDGVERSFSFLTFRDDNDNTYYTLPSIIGINNDNTLLYGYLPNSFSGKIIRYFKQKTFYSLNKEWDLDAMYHSIWYIAYILFDLEERFGTNFSIQIGAPSDSSHLDEAKQMATRIVVSAYKLVEDVFKNDKKFFLACTYQDLVELTEIVPFSQEIKDDYALLVFPEAYACLMPLISHGKIETKMNLMVDIGGGTTDISFFSIESKKNMPKVYDFFSINKGLNYLTCAESSNNIDLDSVVRQSSSINPDREKQFKIEIQKVIKQLIRKLVRELERQTSINKYSLFDALKNRPIVYCGGGSTFELLRVEFNPFTDVKLISHSEWETALVSNFNDIYSQQLCPLLSTAYGLAIPSENDEIECTPLEDIFCHLRGVEVNDNIPVGGVYGYGGDDFNYFDDYSAYK